MKLADEAILNLKDKKNLIELDVSHTTIRGIYFPFLSNLLEKLNCSYNENIVDKVFILLKSKTKLTEFDVSFTEVTGKFFAFLPGSLKLLCRPYKLTEEAQQIVQERGWDTLKNRHGYGYQS